MPIETREQLMEKLEAFGDFDTDEQRKDVVCSLIGHSRIQTQFWGYYYCGRCGTQVGDSLGSIYPEAEAVVVVGHNCETCRKNAETLTWRDTVFAPDPFAEETEDDETNT